MPTLYWIFGIFHFAPNVTRLAFAPIYGAKVQQKIKNTTPCELGEHVHPFETSKSCRAENGNNHDVINDVDGAKDDSKNGSHFTRFEHTETGIGSRIGVVCSQSFVSQDQSNNTANESHEEASEEERTDSEH